MAGLNLTQLLRELHKAEQEIRQRGDMPPEMEIHLPCRAAVDLSRIRYDIVKVNVKLGNEVLLHFFREDLVN